MPGFDHEEDLREKMLSSEEIFRGRVMHVFRDRIVLSGGRTGERELLRHIGAVCIVPLTDKGEVVLERQFRYAPGLVLTEIPAGKLDSPEEDRLAAARRELSEETGYLAEEWIDLGDFYPAPDYSDERITLFLARGLRRGPQHLDADETLHIFTLPLKDALEEVAAGRIPDAKTQMALLRTAQFLRGE